MRFDLLDEYSTLVPRARASGPGVSRNEDFQEPAVPAKVAERRTIASFARHLASLCKLPGALRQMVLASYRNLVAKY